MDVTSPTGRGSLQSPRNSESLRTCKHLRRYKVLLVAETGHGHLTESTFSDKAMKWPAILTSGVRCPPPQFRQNTQSPAKKLEPSKRTQQQQMRKGHWHHLKPLQGSHIANVLECGLPSAFSCLLHPHSLINVRGSMLLRFHVMAVFPALHLHCDARSCNSIHSSSALSPLAARQRLSSMPAARGLHTPFRKCCICSQRPYNTLHKLKPGLRKI